MSAQYVTSAIAAAVNGLQQYVSAGRVAIGVQQGGQVLEILVLDPTLAITPLAGLILLHRGDATTPWVYADPSSGLQPF